jgi:glyceraldehyde-3-phosphate dehydrogenase/erythrose-4-phosphate dehydrogenase
MNRPKSKIAINGFGLIGRALALRISQNTDLHLVAINEVGFGIDDAVQLLSRSSAQAGIAMNCNESPDAISLNGHHVSWLGILEPERLPWADLEIDVVIEAAQFFARSELEAQSDGGRIKVLMTGDLRRGLPDMTVVPCVNADQYQSDYSILCAGSDRAQSLCPVLLLLDQMYGVETFQFAVHRPPYGGREWLIGSRATDIEQLARIVPAWAAKGQAFRIEELNATHATIWLEAALSNATTVPEISDLLVNAAADKFARVIFTGTQIGAPNGTTHSCHIDLDSVRVVENRVWIEIRYDPVTSYVERICDILKLITSR